MRGRWMRMAIAVGALAACASASRDNTTRATAAAVAVIDSVAPSRGPAGTANALELTLYGRHFADSGNVVTFGPVPVTGLRSSMGGQRIVFYAPKEAVATGEVPPQVLLPGTYLIRVRTAAGESNSVPFVLTPEQASL